MQKLNLNPAFALGPIFPNERRINDKFWIEAASDSRPVGFSKINNIRCLKNVKIQGSGRRETHTKVKIIAANVYVIISFRLVPSISKPLALHVVIPMF